MTRTGWAVWVLLLGLVGCGGDGAEPREPDSSTSSTPSTTATEPPGYYLGLAALTRGLDEANTAGDEELHEAIPTTDPADIGDLFSRVTTESADRLRALLVEMRRLRPPADAGAAHEELITASQAELALSYRVAEAFAGLDQAGVDAYEPPADQAQIEARVDHACLALQALADDSGADVDICVGMFAEPGLG